MVIPSVLRMTNIFTPLEAVDPRIPKLLQTWVTRAYPINVLENCSVPGDAASVFMVAFGYKTLQFKWSMEEEPPEKNKPHFADVHSNRVDLVLQKEIYIT